LTKSGKTAIHKHIPHIARESSVTRAHIAASLNQVQKACETLFFLNLGARRFLMSPRGASLRGVARNVMKQSHGAMDSKKNSSQGESRFARNWSALLPN
jgi:recombinational DNA repair ATPase RecF